MSRGTVSQRSAASWIRKSQIICVQSRQDIKMACQQILCLVFISGFVLANGFSLDDLRVKRQAMTGAVFEDCSRPPTNGHINLCCRLPKERIWGDMKGSFRKCFNKARIEGTARRQVMGEEDGEKATTTGPVQEDEANTEVNGGELVTSAPGSGFFVMPVAKRPGRRRLHISETATNVFTSIYKVIKDTFDVLRDSVVMLTDHFHLRRNDQCVMECVFQDQGFLVEKLVNKEALLRRLHATLGRNDVWHRVAVRAVEVCHDSYLGIPPNSTCQSGSEEIFRCVFKFLFFNCPSWPENNEYCKAVKEFYARCPDGPPPPVEDRHVTTTPEPESESVTSPEVTPESETERK